jgi:FixJ family two-component response regulator
LLAAGPEWPYHCFVLDVRLPGMSGLELHRFLVRRQVRTPVVIVSADDDPQTREQARRQGAVAFFGKTESGALLIDTIERHADACRAAGCARPPHAEQRRCER